MKTLPPGVPPTAARCLCLSRQRELLQAHHTINVSEAAARNRSQQIGVGQPHAHIRSHDSGEHALGVVGRGGADFCPGCFLGAFCLAMLYRTLGQSVSQPRFDDHTWAGAGRAGWCRVALAISPTGTHQTSMLQVCCRLRWCGCRGFPYVPPVIARAQCYHSSCLYDMKFYYSNHDSMMIHCPGTVRDCVVDRQLRGVCKFWGPQCGHVCGQSGVYFAKFVWCIWCIWCGNCSPHDPTQVSPLTNRVSHLAWIEPGEWLSTQATWYMLQSKRSNPNTEFCACKDSLTCAFTTQSHESFPSLILLVM
jgi:hypothetical protein